MPLGLGTAPGDSGDRLGTTLEDLGTPRGHWDRLRTVWGHNRDVVPRHTGDTVGTSSGTTTPGNSSWGQWGHIGDNSSLGTSLGEGWEHVGDSGMGWGQLGDIPRGLRGHWGHPQVPPAPGQQLGIQWGGDGSTGVNWPILVLTRMWAGPGAVRGRRLRLAPSTGSSSCGGRADTEPCPFPFMDTEGVIRPSTIPVWSRLLWGRSLGSWPLPFGVRVGPQKATPPLLSANR